MIEQRLVPHPTKQEGAANGDTHKQWDHPSKTSVQALCTHELPVALGPPVANGSLASSNSADAAVLNGLAAHSKAAGLHRRQSSSTPVSPRPVTSPTPSHSMTDNDHSSPLPTSSSSQEEHFVTVHLPQPVALGAAQSLGSRTDPNRSGSLPSEEIGEISRMTLENGAAHQQLMKEAVAHHHHQQHRESQPMASAEVKPSPFARASGRQRDLSHNQRANGHGGRHDGRSRGQRSFDEASFKSSGPNTPHMPHSPQYVFPYGGPHMQPPMGNTWAVQGQPVQYPPGGAHGPVPVMPGGGYVMVPHYPHQMTPDGVPIFLDPRLGPQPYPPATPQPYSPTDQPFLMPMDPMAAHLMNPAQYPVAPGSQEHMLMLQQHKQWQDVQQVQHMQLQIHAAMRGGIPPVGPRPPPGDPPAGPPLPHHNHHHDSHDPRQGGNAGPVHRSGSRRTLSEASSSGPGLMLPPRGLNGATGTSSHPFRGPDSDRSANGLPRGPSFGSLTGEDRRRAGGAHRRQLSMPLALEDRQASGNLPRGAQGERRHGHRRVRSVDDADSPPTSSVLARFKSDRSFEPNLEDLQGSIYDFCRDQFGSRYVQHKLANATAEQVEGVWAEIQDRVLRLMRDVFGNYVVQKLLEHPTWKGQEKLAEKLQGQVLTLSQQMYGCRVVQTALQVLDESWQVQLVKELEGRVIECVADQNGNHVIQKCLASVHPSSRIRFIVEELMGTAPSPMSHSIKGTIEPGVVALSRHPYGCRVVQRVLEHCDIEGVREQAMGQILEVAGTLAQDTYGNYVIQHILQQGDDTHRAQLMAMLKGHVVDMSMHKFASNVVEKGIEFGTPEQRDVLVSEVLSEQEDGTYSPHLQEMIRDQFGNYVVQKVLENCREDQRDRLVRYVHDQLHYLEKLTYAKHLVMRVKKLLEAINARDTAEAAPTQEAADSAAPANAQEAAEAGEGPATTQGESNDAAAQGTAGSTESA
ncbi:hypothetical protein WJX73_006290 [Symbiochloris irregularis]|uniref:PUM-HD domain-containing protein n=1 Tax=Symbiochloris irregularis TaxID=706552 RepID=A0AAW1P303_9CHLO